MHNRLDSIILIESSSLSKHNNQDEHNKCGGKEKLTAYGLSRVELQDYLTRKLTAYGHTGMLTTRQHVTL